MAFAFNFGAARPGGAATGATGTAHASSTGSARGGARELAFVRSRVRGPLDSSEGGSGGEGPVVDEAFVETVLFVANTRIRAINVARLEADAQEGLAAVAVGDGAGAGEDSIASSLQMQSDLIPGVYEGGLKVWECAADLSNYLIAQGGELRGKHVLEVGCGAGYPGIVAMARGAHVDFQDYNADVLLKVTMPNVSMNTSRDWIEDEVEDEPGAEAEEESKGKVKGKGVAQEGDRADADPSAPETKRVKSGDAGEEVPLAYVPRYFAGDWGALSELMGEREEFQYDLLLTSETIYEPASQARLYEFLKRRLRRPSGRVLLAAKTYYFGVGGGTRQFEALLRGEGLLASRVVYVCTEGVKREILELTWA
jgi:predicted nicotinamide N-methyase